MKEIDIGKLYKKLKDAGYEIKIFRWKHETKKEVGIEISFTAQDLNPERIAKYPDCHIKASKGNVEIIATNENFEAFWEENTHREHKPTLRKITSILINTLDDLKCADSQGATIHDKYHNMENLMYPEYEEDGIEAWLQLPDTGDAIATVLQLKDVPKTRLEAALKLIELGQPISQFYGVSVEEYASIESLEE